MKNHDEIMHWVGNIWTAVNKVKRDQEDVLEKLRSAAEGINFVAGLLILITIINIVVSIIF